MSEPENEPITPAPTDSAPTEAIDVNAEIARLTEENMRLTAEIGRKPRREHRITMRSVGAIICFIMAAVLTAPAVVGFWGQRTLTDTSRYVDTVAPLADDPTIQNAVAGMISKALTEKLNVQALVTKWLPPEAQPLAGPVSGAVNSFIDSQIKSFLATDTFKQLWIEINTEAQKGLMRAMSGDQSGAIQVKGDSVVLDLGTLITKIKDQLVAGGLTILDKVPLPSVADQQIVLLQSAELAQVRTIYSFSVPIARWLMLVVLVLYLSAIALARRRPRMVVAIGIALILAMVVLRTALSYGEAHAASSLSTGPFGASITQFFDALTVYLLMSIRTVFAIGLIMVILGWLFGVTESAMSTRRLLSHVMTGAGERAGSAGPLATAGAWVAGKKKALIGLIIAAAGLVLIMQNPLEAGTLFLLVILVLIGVAVVLILAAAAPPPGYVRPSPVEPSIDEASEVRDDADSQVTEVISVGSGAGDASESEGH